MHCILWWRCNRLQAKQWHRLQFFRSSCSQIPSLAVARKYRIQFPSLFKLIAKLFLVCIIRKALSQNFLQKNDSSFIILWALLKRKVRRIHDSATRDESNTRYIFCGSINSRNWNCIIIKYTDHSNNTKCISFQFPLIIFFLLLASVTQQNPPFRLLCRRVELVLIVLLV